MQLTPGAHNSLSGVGQQSIYANPTVGSMRPYNIGSSNSKMNSPNQSIRDGMVITTPGKNVDPNSLL